MIGAGTAFRRREQDPEALEEFMEWSFFSLVVLLQRHESLAAVSILARRLLPAAGDGRSQAPADNSIHSLPPENGKPKISCLLQRALLSEFMTSSTPPSLARCSAISMDAWSIWQSPRKLRPVEVSLTSLFSSRGPQLPIMLMWKVSSIDQ